MVKWPAAWQDYEAHSGTNKRKMWVSEIAYSIQDYTADTEYVYLQIYRADTAHSVQQHTEDTQHTHHASEHIYIQHTA